MDNKTTEIMGLFDKILHIVDNGSSNFLSRGKITVPEDELLDVLDQLKRAIPQEVERAGQILANSETIINNARKEADEILQEANERAQKIVAGAEAERDNMLLNSEIVRTATEVAKELQDRSEASAKSTRENANIYAAQIRGDALKYLDDIMKQMASTLQEASVGVTNALQSNIASLMDSRNYIDTELNKLNSGEGNIEE